MLLGRIDIEKNKLDLLYQEKIQLLNAYYIAITTGVIGLVGTFVWFPEKIFFGVVMSLFILIFFLYFITILRKEMQEILNKMEKLKEKLRN